jgi:hypothetical protein
MNELKGPITVYCLQMASTLHKSLSEELLQSDRKGRIEKTTIYL